MTRIFIFGASTVYGVGGESGGWADLVKLEFHKKMFSESGVGEQFEVYNFGRPGVTSEFVMRNAVHQLSEYRGNAKVISIISVGGNDAKAVDEPSHFVSTPDEYGKKMLELLHLLQTESDQVIAVGGGYYDETKTNPVLSPSGNSYFFTNKRKKLFEHTFRKVCKEKNIPFVTVDVSEQEWNEKYGFRDGLHPNRFGHEYIAERVMKKLELILS